MLRERAFRLFSLGSRLVEGGKPHLFIETPNNEVRIPLPGRRRRAREHAHLRIGLVDGATTRRHLVKDHAT